MYLRALSSAASHLGRRMGPSRTPDIPVGVFGRRGAVVPRGRHSEILRRTLPPPPGPGLALPVRLALAWLKIVVFFVLQPSPTWLMWWTRTAQVKRARSVMSRPAQPLNRAHLCKTVHTCNISSPPSSPQPSLPSVASDLRCVFSFFVVVVILGAGRC